MSETVIFIIGAGVFAVTTTATLLYGYTWFTGKAAEAGVEVVDGFSDEADDADSTATGNDDLLAVPIDISRFYRQLPLTPSR